MAFVNSFVSGSAVSGRRVSSSTKRSVRTAVVKMNAEKKNKVADTKTQGEKYDADETRRLLNDGKSMVQFGRNVPKDAAQQNTGYQAGSTGVDVWLITGALVFLVPVIITIVGVKTGWIDLNPR
mmetsp:Transcript_4540/g.13754  ORF Transcript_4540/g.13754 Transcript_4540/m.13754 type:complete len:124 (+) Transcript_4540:63-434(+)